MNGFEKVKADCLYSHEIAWEVMEQSKKYGEKPVRLVFSANCIRTITSETINKPTSQIMEYWRIKNSEIVKVSWCSELCVLAVRYTSKVDHEKVVSKVFFVDCLKGKRCFDHYKKIKPLSIPATIINTNAPKNTYYKNLSNLPTCFFLKDSLKYEKFYRIRIREEAKEMFLGISPTTIRILDPVSLEASVIIEIMSVFELKDAYHLGDTILKIKYYIIGTGNTKTKKLVLIAFPITRNNIRKWYNFCINFGEAADHIGKLKKSKSTSSITSVNTNQNSMLSVVSDKNTNQNSVLSVIGDKNTNQNRNVPLDGKVMTTQLLTQEVPRNSLLFRKSVESKENYLRHSRKGINYC